LAIKLVNYPTNVKCCSCLFYKISPLSDINNKLIKYVQYSTNRYRNWTELNNDGPKPEPREIPGVH
jgi:hypothetical protein